MTNIELYLEDQLADTEKRFSVRLNRQLMKPSELNTKDAQYSYSISLPLTPNNNRIMGFTNVEEVKGKFVKMYKAHLLVDLISVFKGYFRLFEISNQGYKGNLVIPAVKTIKDIFGDLTLNETPEYLLPFGDFNTSISKINRAAISSPQKAIFPFVLYGLLPKQKNKEGEYSSEEQWDASVRLTRDEIPPSVNCLMLLKHLFKSKGYTLQGSVFTDYRLTELYQSYHNPPDYEMPWNYGFGGKISLEGRWSNAWDKKEDKEAFEFKVYRSDDRGYQVFSANLFDSTNSNIWSNEIGSAENILFKTVKEGEENIRKTEVTIPFSGLYKVRFTARIKVNTNKNGVWRNKKTQVLHISGRSEGPDNNPWHNDLADIVYEVKLLRDRNKRDFGLVNAQLDGKFYFTNQPQDEDKKPRWFPQVREDGTQLNFIDPYQNSNYVLGFTWGGMQVSNRKTKVTNTWFVNPLDKEKRYTQVCAAKPIPSWNEDFKDVVNKLAVESPGYFEYYTDEYWKNSDKYEYHIKHAPTNRAERGNLWHGAGAVHAVVWLEKGEGLSVASVSMAGDYQDYREYRNTVRGWVGHEIYFTLDLVPFKKEASWINLQLPPLGKYYMNWAEKPDFNIDSIDLARFLPLKIKVNDYLENFLKAFNLRLTRINDKTFSLDVKQSKKPSDIVGIDLDKKASVTHRVNTSLDLPSKYKIGFTVNTDEEGYFMTQDDGGGEYITNALGDKVIEQKSTFSYGWFKGIIQETPFGAIYLLLPVISKHEAWDKNEPYEKRAAKRYTDLPIRFWYPTGDLGVIYDLGERDAVFAKVSNTIRRGGSILNYKNYPYTLLRNFFTLVGVGGESHYTEVEAYLTPQQYAMLDGSYLVSFNGDLYYIAEIEGYDPTNRNKTKLKLIRKL